jgi:hypothetical protein
VRADAAAPTGDRWRGFLGEHTPMLQTMRDEVVGITATPGGLRPRATSDLTGCRRTRALATTHAVVRHKPSATDAAGPLREHPQMLPSTAGNQGGPLLASTPGSILASAEGTGQREGRRRDESSSADSSSGPTWRIVARWQRARRSVFLRLRPLCGLARCCPLNTRLTPTAGC